MEYRRLGHSGLQVSVIGLGTHYFGPRIDYPAAERVLHQALGEGINFIETANGYGDGQAETFIGTALRDKRPQVLLATKVGGNRRDGPNMHGGSRKNILDQVESSLQRLRTDYIDLYQIHRYDPHTRLEETLRTLDSLVQQGKVRYVGCANFAAWQVAEAMGLARNLGIEPLVSVESECGMLERGIEQELLPCCSRYNVGVLPHFPLVGGFDTGKHKRIQQTAPGTRVAAQKQGAASMLRSEDFDVRAQLEAFAAARSRPLVELAFARLLAHPQVSSVIAGAATPKQISANAKAADWHLSSAEVEELDGILRALPRPMKCYVDNRQL